MTPTQADDVIAAIKARLTRLAWSPEVWADFRSAMLRVRIDAEQGRAAVSAVVMTSKSVPGPAHFLEAFKAAQGEQHQTCSPATPASGYRGEFWHPQGWAIVRAWFWMRAEENWPKLPELLAEYGRTFGVPAPDWEAILAPDAHERFSSGEIANLCGWVRQQIPAVRRRESGADEWKRKHDEAQARRVRVITELRKQAARKAAGKE